MKHPRIQKKLVYLSIVLILTLCATAIRPAIVATASDGTDTQAFLTAARSFTEQAEAAGNHHLAAEPVITVTSKQIQAGKMTVTMDIEAMDVLNSGPRDDQPVIAGQLQYLQDHGAALSVTAKKAIEDDITYWRSTIDSAMTVPTLTCYPIKVTANVDTAGNIDISTLQVYADNGAVGSNFIPAAQFFRGLRSVLTTVAQAYANAASMASAKDPAAPKALLRASYSPTSAYQYADAWVASTTSTCSDGTTYQNTANWNNSAYPSYVGRDCNDCADYVSQCLHAGGISTSSTWQYPSGGSPTTAWCNVTGLKNYLVNNSYVTYNVTLVNCKCGDPFFFDVGGTLVHTVFMVYNDGTTFKYDAHTNDRKRLVWDGTLGGYTYHYTHVTY